MGRRNRGRMEAMLTINLSKLELEEIHRRAREAGFKVTAEWVRRQLIGDFTPPPEPTAEAT